MGLFSLKYPTRSEAKIITVYYQLFKSWILDYLNLLVPIFQLGVCDAFVLFFMSMEIDLTNSDLDESSLPSPPIKKNDPSESCINISSESECEMQTNISEDKQSSEMFLKVNDKRTHCISSSDESDREIPSQTNESDHNELKFVPFSERLMFPISSVDRNNAASESVQSTSHSPDEETNGISRKNYFSNYHDISSDSNDSNGPKNNDQLLTQDGSDTERRDKKNRKIMKSSTAKAGTQELKEKKKEELLQAKERRKAERLEKQLAKEKEKLLKKIEAEKLKNSKPGDCLKNIKVLMDPHFLDLPEGPVLLGLLQSQEIPYETHSQPVLCSITWKRQHIDSQLKENNEIEKFIQESDESKVLIILPSEKFLQLVYNFKQEQVGNQNGETLMDYVDMIKQNFPGKRITLIVKGCEQHFRNLRNKRQRTHRQDVLGHEETQRKTKRKKQQTSTPDVSDLDVEECIISLQINGNCNIHMIETTADVAFIIIAYSKALAIAPYKQEKAQNESFLWMINNAKTNSVSNSGEGLLALWQKHIQQFHGASEETSQAIASQYPSPFVLMQAFKEKGEKLLQDIEVRRGAGPLATTRRVGPELSRKLFYSLTITNHKLNLNSR